MPMPVISRSSGAATDAGSTSSSPALDSAAITADAAKSPRGSTRAGRPRNAPARQPIPKPAPTPLVTAAGAKGAGPRRVRESGQMKVSGEGRGDRRSRKPHGNRGGLANGDDGNRGPL